MRCRVTPAHAVFVAAPTGSASLLLGPFHLLFTHSGLLLAPLMLYNGLTYARVLVVMRFGLMETR